MLIPNVSDLPTPIDWPGLMGHELAHWKRGDHLTDLLAEIAVCLAPWHPLVWWVRKRLKHLSQLACDDWVLAAQADPGLYAASILRLVPRRGVALAPGATSDGKSLATRLRRILAHRRPEPRLGAWWSFAVGVVAICMVMFLSLAQARVVPLVHGTGFRTVLFPAVRSVGEVYMRFWCPGSYEASWAVSSWEPVTAGRGAVEVPSEMQLMLKVSGEASKDLSWIGCLDSKELIHGLLLTKAEISGGDLAHLKSLPALGELRLDCDKISEAALAQLGGLSSLGRLRLTCVSISNSGLAHLRGLTSLRILDLRGSHISDEGLAHLSKLKSITVLNLTGTKVTDEGLIYLKSMSALRWLSLDRTQVSDAGLACVGQVTSLQELSLNGSKVTSQGLAHLTAITRLRTLDVCGTKIDDAALGVLSKMPSLKGLNVRYTDVTDEGLAHLENLASLRQLLVDGSRVTERGLKQLKRALPNCRFTVGHL